MYTWTTPESTAPVTFLITVSVFLLPWIISGPGIWHLETSPTAHSLFNYPSWATLLCSVLPACVSEPAKQSLAPAVPAEVIRYLPEPRACLWPCVAVRTPSLSPERTIDSFCPCLLSFLAKATLTSPFRIPHSQSTRHYHGEDGLWQMFIENRGGMWRGSGIAQWDMHAMGKWVIKPR